MFSWTESHRHSAGADIPRNLFLVGAKSLIANSVYDAEGRLVGKIEELVLDTRTGCVRHAVLAVGGILGIGRKRIAVPWSALNPDAHSRRCVVDVEQMHFTAVPVPHDDPWLQRKYSTQVIASRSRHAHAAGARAA